MNIKLKSAWIAAAPYLAEFGAVSFVACGIFAVFFAACEFLRPGFVASYVSPGRLAAVALSGAALSMAAPPDGSAPPRRGFYFCFSAAAIAAGAAAWYYFSSTRGSQALAAAAAAVIIAGLFLAARTGKLQQSL